MSVPVRVHHAVRLEQSTEDTVEPVWRWKCACGQVGAMWWQSSAKAQTGGDRHLLSAGSDTDRLVTATAKAVAALDVVDVIVDEARDWEWPLSQRAFSVWLRRLNAATENGRSV